MKDRVSLYPGRVKMIPVPGKENTYDMVRADEPTQEGDPLNKATLLKDSTAAMHGLRATATPNDVFAKLAMPYGYHGFDVTTVFSDGTPVPYVVLNGLQDLSGNTAITDADGRCAVAVAENRTPTITVSDYIGVADAEATVSAEDGVVFTPVTITLERDTSIHLIQTSQSINVLPGVPVDMCLVGGGAGGRSGTGSRVAYAGGGGGYVKNIFGVTLVNPEITVTIGAGGSSNGAGGSTEVTYDGKTESADGGASSVGNGNGGSNANGSDGTVHVFEDQSLTLPGGGGGSGKDGTSGPYTGGADFGGSGACYSVNATHVHPQAGTGPGGGGGGGYAFSSSNYVGGASGASGALYIRVNAPGVSA